MNTITTLLEEHTDLITKKKAKIREINSRPFKLTWKNIFVSLTTVLLLLVTFLMEQNVVVESLFTGIFIYLIVYAVIIIISSNHYNKVLLLDEERAKKMDSVTSMEDKLNLIIASSKKEKTLSSRYTFLTIILGVGLIFVLLFIIQTLKISTLGIQVGGCVLFLFILLYTTEQVFKELERLKYTRKVIKQLDSIMSEVRKQI